MNYKISIRARKNKRNHSLWGKMTYWMYQSTKYGEKVETSHINSDVELEKKDIQELVSVVSEKYNDKSHCVINTYGVIVDYLKGFLKQDIEIVRNPQEIRNIIDWVKGQNT